MNQELNQIEITYSPIEDRLIMVLRMQDFSEYRLWITRKFAKMLWSILIELTQMSPAPPKEIEQQMHKTQTRFEKEQAARQVPTPAQYGMQVATQPLGKDPVLVSRIQVHRQEDNSHLLLLLSEQGHSYQLSCNDMLVQSLARLLSASVKKASWDLDFRFRDLRADGHNA